MSLQEPCLACQSTDPCECRNALRGYFRLLESGKAKQVLRVKPASFTCHPKVIGGGVDKLNGYFQRPFAVNEWQLFVRAKGIAMKRVHLKDRRAYFEVGTSPQVIHLKLDRFGESIVGLVSNPNHHLSWAQYLNFLQKVISQDSLDSIQITRIDLNLDFDISFKELISSLDFDFKQSSLIFMDQSGERTGLSLGKGAEIVVVYDKGRKERTPHSWSRIEVRLSKNKLPTKSLSQVSATLLRSSAFSHIKGLHFSNPNLYNQLEKEKFVHFLFLAERDGFFAAKKQLNQQRNFRRDISKLVEIQMWDKQPIELFQSTLNRFLTNQIKEKKECRKKTNAQLRAQ
jgi:hypothetical protein